MEDLQHCWYANLVRFSSGSRLNIALILGVDNPLYTVTVDNAATSWAVFSFINAGGLWEQLVSIDEHPMYVFGTFIRILPHPCPDLHVETEVEGEYVNVSEPVSVIPVSAVFTPCSLFKSHRCTVDIWSTSLCRCET